MICYDIVLCVDDANIFVVSDVARFCTLGNLRGDPRITNRGRDVVFLTIPVMSVYGAASECVCVTQKNRRRSERVCVSENLCARSCVSFSRLNGGRTTG